VYTGGQGLPLHAGNRKLCFEKFHNQEIASLAAMSFKGAVLHVSSENRKEMDMTQQNRPSVTQRAYTLRLYGANSEDASWRKALWLTHEAVNNGAKTFGDWLLTLRGGLDHTLADAKVKGAKGKPDRDPSIEERKKRRILLALSWLSVESKRGAPAAYIIATGREITENRNSKVVAAFEEILKSRGLTDTEIAEWRSDCTASLSATIRDDAVWVNRSKAFDDAAKSVGRSLTREQLWDMLDPFFGSRDAYLAPTKSSEDDSLEEEQGEKAKDLVQKAGKWLSSRFGTGEGADFSRIADVYEKITAWADAFQVGKTTTGDEAIKNLAAALSEFKPVSNDLTGVLRLISGPGYKSATRNHLNSLFGKKRINQEDIQILKTKAANDAQQCRQNTGSKGYRPYANAILKDVEDACGFTYRTDKDNKDVSVSDYSKFEDGYRWGPARHSEFAVMLDHAARRVSLAHTWIKRAEVERRRFEDDALKREQVPENVKKWLDDFCWKRSEASGALESYRIRRRAVDGWKNIVGAWSKAECRTMEDRITAARALQDDPDIEKFGDIQLFEALAEDDAVCVWYKDGDPAKEPEPQNLIDYALAAEADYKKRQFKVPAYRHPDALLHPVFCDFGESRWDISFSVHQQERNKSKLNNKKMITQGSPLRGLSLTLLTNIGIKPVLLCWQSKRLARDLALVSNADKGHVVNVSRADRLGRAASAVTENDTVAIESIFEEKKWNGRLQAPRRQLEAIAAVQNNSRFSAEERARRIQRMRERIRWVVTFSARLQPQGPWCEYAEKHRFKPDPRYWPHAEINKNRKGYARLILSRLPGLRVLSVDLGHRYAAACVVWEAVDAAHIKEACRAAGRESPNESDLYLHLKTKGQDGKERITIYRRIGADALPGNTPHPASWARLDRQFLIKLQGEEEGAREASNEEIWAVHRLESGLGRVAPLIDKLIAAGWGGTDKQKARLEALKQLGWSDRTAAASAGAGAEADEESGGIVPSLAVDELMSSAVRTMRLGLKRHGDRARIAFYLVTEEKTMPGGVKNKLDEQGKIDLITDALILWHDLFSSRGWCDDAAKKLWDDYIAKLSVYRALEEGDKDDSGSERRKQKDENRRKLYNVAEALLQDTDLQQRLHNAWKKRWEEDDEWWKRQLRWFRDWLLPRGKHTRDPGIRKAGGLSLIRIATLTEFRRKVQVGFFTRLRPDGTREEIKEQFGQSTLDALEHLREQRVKQLASRIVEGALGVGSESPRHWDGCKRPRRCINDQRFAPCHAVVIEDLTHYRPEETRTRRENRQLMIWSSSKVKKFLSEACQLYGLHLREVSPSYTSRQDSRTGAPGIRCQDVSVCEFMRSPFWRKQVKKAKAKQDKNEGDAREKFLCDVDALWNDKTAADWVKAGFIRVPINGGEIFVSADPNSPAANGLQADLNAAANIGLRALSDPDWPGRWWYVPCERADFRPVKDKVEGSAVVKLNQVLRQPTQGKKDGINKKKKDGDSRVVATNEVVNLWRDISSLPLESAEAGEWKEYAAYTKEVQYRVVNILKKQIQGRCGQPHDRHREDDISF
jgi:IS605 OrfB family transposase